MLKLEDVFQTMCVLGPTQELWVLGKKGGGEGGGRCQEVTKEKILIINQHLSSLQNLSAFEGFIQSYHIISATVKPAVTEL